MFKGQIGAEPLGIHPEVFISIMLIKQWSVRNYKIIVGAWADDEKVQNLKHQSSFQHSLKTGTKGQNQSSLVDSSTYFCLRIDISQRQVSRRSSQALFSWGDIKGILMRGAPLGLSTIKLLLHPSIYLLSMLLQIQFIKIITNMHSYILFKTNACLPEVIDPRHPALPGTHGDKIIDTEYKDKNLRFHTERTTKLKIIDLTKLETDQLCGRVRVKENHKDDKHGNKVYRIDSKVPAQSL